MTINAPDYRYNPFDQIFSSFGHGYSGNPKEQYKIPTTSPYYVFLNEIPREDSPSTLLINEKGGSSFTEVSASTSPSSGQFRAIYGGDESSPVSVVGQGTIEFDSSDAGKVLEIAYYGMGAIIQNQFLNKFLAGEFDNAEILAANELRMGLDIMNQDSNDLNIPGETEFSITALSDSRIALVAQALGHLRTYDLVGLDWVQVGNSLSITGMAIPRITALSSNRVAFVDAGNTEMRTYDFDGTDWAQVGNSLSVAMGSPAITSLSSARIAFIDGINRDLRTYDFDGTDWAQVGNDLPYGATIGDSSLAALSSSRIAHIDSTNLDLRAYDFNGTEWVQVGNELSFSAITGPIIASLAANRIVFIDETNKELTAYDFNDSDFLEIGRTLTITSIGTTSLTGLSSTRIAFIDNINEDLRSYFAINTNINHPNPALN